MKYHVEFFGLRTWHEVETNNNSYPFVDKTRALKFLDFKYNDFFRKVPVRLIDNTGHVHKVIGYFNFPKKV